MLCPGEHSGRKERRKEGRKEGVEGVVGDGKEEAKEDV